MSTQPESEEPLTEAKIPQITSPAELAKLTANAVAGGQNAAADLRALGKAVIEMAEQFNQSCEREAAAIETATEEYSGRATRFAMTVFAQGTQVSTIRDAVAEIQPGSRVVARRAPPAPPAEADAYGRQGGSGGRNDIARDLDLADRPLPAYLRQGPARNDR